MIPGTYNPKDISSRDDSYEGHDSKGHMIQGETFRDTLVGNILTLHNNLAGPKVRDKAYLLREMGG